ncbi:MAG: aminotransferase [Alphaproteobacteria bacterium]|nr:aminotransferase [Alphaproteobacteria bacterium]
MTRNLPFNTTELREKDNEHVIHPWGFLNSSDKQDTLLLADSESIYVRDTDGEQYIDGPGGMWCVQIGYGNEEMAQTIADQVRRMTYFSPFGKLSTPPHAELGAKIAELAPGDLNRVFFATGGSTAVDSAVRFAWFYFNVTGRPDKKAIISREGAYHGSTYLAASLCGKPRDTTHMDLMTNLVHHLPSPNPYRRPDGMSEAEFCTAKVKDLEDKILEIGPDRVACFIAEPILASGGVIIPPDGYHRKCLEVCRKHGVLYISDEVVTGFGRLGHMFASDDVFGVVPDIIICAKGLTSGYIPLGAFIASEKLYQDILDSDEKTAVFSNGFTYSGHPVACAAALKNIEIMERNDLCGHVRKITPHFQQRLRALGNHPMVGDVRGVGLMGCVECVSDRKTKEPFPWEMKVGATIDRKCQDKGLILRPMGHLCVFSPPLVIASGQVDQMFDIMSAAITETADELVRSGTWKG